MADFYETGPGYPVTKFHPRRQGQSWRQTAAQPTCLVAVVVLAIVG